MNSTVAAGVGGSADMRDVPSAWAVCSMDTRRRGAGREPASADATRSDSCGSPRCLVSSAFEGVVERFERLYPERPLHQPVGEPGVLGQQRAMQVRADHAVADHALEARLARVAVAPQD